MKTSNLIRALATDSDGRAITPGRALALALLPAIAVALGIHFALLGLRPQLFSLLGDPRVLFKLALPILLRRALRPADLASGQARHQCAQPRPLARHRAGSSGGRHAGGTPHSSTGPLGSQTYRLECDGLPEERHVSCPSAACCRLIGAAPGRAGTSRTCRRCGRPFRRGDWRGLLRNTLP
jgi:hypothetical protein